MDSKQELKEEIARVAKEIYEHWGISGMEVENWLKAERIVLDRKGYYYQKNMKAVLDVAIHLEPFRQ